MAKPDGWVTKNQGLRDGSPAGWRPGHGQFKLLEHATAEMQVKGPNAAMSGTDSRDQSGRAILAQQAGGAAQPTSRWPMPSAVVAPRHGNGVDGLPRVWTGSVGCA
jgi:hypothetical protein